MSSEKIFKQRFPIAAREIANFGEDAPPAADFLHEGFEKQGKLGYIPMESVLYCEISKRRS